MFASEELVGSPTRAVADNSDSVSPRGATVRASVPETEASKNVGNANQNGNISTIQRAGRMVRARKKLEQVETKRKEIDEEVERYARAADSATDKKAIMGEGWGTDHGYSGISFSSLINKRDGKRLQNRVRKKKMAPALSDDLDQLETELLANITAAYKKIKKIREGDVEDEEASNDRAVLVSFQLPFSLVREDDCWTAVSREDIGLGISTVERMKYDWTWVGWPGEMVPGGEQQTLKKELLENNDFAPVFLNTRAAKLCSDFCHRIIEPVLYSTVLTTDIQMEMHDPDTESRKPVLEQEMWTAYTTVMQQFADVVKENYEDGDVIWIDGYHLMYLPKLIRRLLPDATIGFSLNAPFPTSEIFLILPKREELLHGLLSCDLIGLQSLGYARHLTSTCMRLLGCSFTPKQINFHGQSVDINIFPKGVSLNVTASIQRRPTVKSKVAELKSLFGTRFVFLNVARPDKDGGVIHALFGFEEFCAMQNKSVSERAVFVQISILSTGMSEGARDRQTEMSISRVAGRINGKYSKMGTNGPIFYLQQNAHVSMDEVYALYEIADCVVTTPLHFGLPLVPSEYILCRKNRQLPGVVIISEFLPSAEGLGGALRVNPYDTEGIARMMAKAILMGKEERERTSNTILSYVRTYTSHRYMKQFSEDLFGHVTTRQIPNYLRKLDSFDFMRSISQVWTQSSGHDTTNTAHDSHGLKDAKDASETTSDLAPSTTPQTGSADMSKQRARRRLIVLDYEGVLVEQKSLAELEVLDESVLTSLRSLGEHPGTDILIFSNHEKDWIASCLEGVRCTIAAESGFFVRWANDPGTTKQHMRDRWEPQNAENTNSASRNWVEHFRPIFEYFKERTPGSIIVEKENSLQWQYQDADAEHGEENALSLASALLETIAGYRVRLERREHCVELMIFGVSKLSILQRYCTKLQKRRGNTERPAILCLLHGENRSDEQVFKYFKGDFMNAFDFVDRPEEFGVSNILCTANLKISEADYYIEKQGDVKRLLVSLA
jgi:trehalose 6-phosphate synthase/phosphatase